MGDINENATNVVQEPTPDSQENSEQQLNQDVSTNESQEPIVDPKNYVPIATHLETKSKLKAMKERLAEFEDAKYSEELKAKKEAVKQRWINKDFDELTAEAIADEIAGVYEELGKARKSHADEILTEQINDLANDSYYSDIGQYKDQIKSKIKQFSKAGEKLSIEDAYLLVKGPRAKMRETTIENEATQSSASPIVNVPTATGTKPQTQYNLDEIDKSALKQLKQYQPDVGWDEKKYYERVIKGRR